MFFLQANLNRAGARSFGAWPYSHLSCQKFVHAPFPREIIVHTRNSSDSVALLAGVISDQGELCRFHLNHCMEITVHTQNSSDLVALLAGVISDQGELCRFHLNHCHSSRSALLKLLRSKTPRPPSFFGHWTRF
jgi:hypothetical protein